MLRVLCLVSLSTLMVATDKPKEEIIKEEIGKLEGTWICVAGKLAVAKSLKRS